jgi:UDP-glucose 4-epimerase
MAERRTMKVLVTGGAGFIGSRAVGRLLRSGHEVCAVDDLSLGREDNLSGCAKLGRFELVKMDVAQPGFADVVSRFQPQRILHLAANSDISKGSRDPRTDLERTFMTTYHVLEAMRLHRLSELVFASTSAIYGEAPGDLPETHGPLEPISLYGAAKLSSEGYVHAYAHLYGMRCFIFRFPNVVGPNLTHGAIFDFVQRLSRDKTHLVVLGDGTQTKPYLDVDDLLDAIFLAIERPATAPVETYNVAGEGATSVREIAEMVRDLTGLTGATIEYGKESRGWPGDVPRFAYDTTKLRALGWKSTKSSNEAVRASIVAEVERCKRSS